MKIKQLFCILLIFIGLLSAGFSEALGNDSIVSYAHWNGHFSTKI